MSVFAVTRSRDEVDIAAASVRRMCDQVDHVIVGDNSTDGAHEELQALVDEGLPVTLHWEDAPNWHQPRVVKQMVTEAMVNGADWIVPFDLDEIWRGTEKRLADALMELPPHVLIVPARLHDHRATALDDPENPDPLTRMGWRNREFVPLPKVAYRARPDVVTADGNHSVSFADVYRPAEVSGVAEVRHFPFRTPEQFVKRVEIAWPQIKEAAQAGHLDRGYGTHVWVYGEELERGGPEALHKWFRDAFFSEDPEADPKLVFDPLPPCQSSS